MLSSCIKHVEARRVAFFKHLARIDEVETVPIDTSNPFRPVKYGRIRLLSYYFKATVKSNEWHWRRKSVPRIELHDDVAYNVACPDVYMEITHLDEDSGARSMNCTDSDEEFTFLIVANENNGFPGAAKYHGLILQKAPVGYPLMPDSREGEYWVRRGTWEEAFMRGKLWLDMSTNEKQTRKLIEKAMSKARVKQPFEII